MLIIGVDHDLLYYNLRVNHYKFELMMASRNVFEPDFKPAHVVEHFITTGQTPAVPITAQGKVVMWRQRFEYLGAGQVLLCIFFELIMQSLTGINGLHGLVVNLHTNPKSACWIDVLCGQDAYGNSPPSVPRGGGNFYVIFQYGTALLGHHVAAAHAAGTAAQIRQEQP